ncbi:MAG: 3-dehydroquinate synthase [Lachnospiraceae bacterium]|nr:3-dehydroquinate synthase [Lachnospiraceae bacterium]
MSKRITVHNKKAQPIYDIVIEKSFDLLCDELKKLGIEKKRLCIVTESKVGPLYAEEIAALLQNQAKEVHIFEFPYGESNKTLNTVQNLYEFLILHKFDRKDMLLALGGGVVGDLTGFTAATYLRGIDFVQIPTSLLAQVDSSIGGKTGVDFSAYKNMVGAFHQPKLVYMNLSVLNTLSDAEYLSGFGEIIKHGCIKDADYFHTLQAQLPQVLARDLDVLEEIIATSCHIKRRVVENDAKEHGERALLNFGHTLGHAIEKLMNFELLHGECVAIGAVAAAHLAMKKNLLTTEEAGKIEAVFAGYQLPTKVPAKLSASDIVTATLNDKKMDAGVIQFILLDGIGNGVISRAVTQEDMLDAIEACR